MKPVSLVLVALPAALAAFRPIPLQMDPGFRGLWTLNVARSDYGGGPKPATGRVNWTEHGWAFALLTSDNHLFTDAVITDPQCALIGDPPDMTCKLEVVSARHVRLTMRQGTAVRLIGDFELLDSNTTKVTHRRTPAQGAPVVERTIWERAAPR